MFGGVISRVTPLGAPLITGAGNIVCLDFRGTPETISARNRSMNRSIRSHHALAMLGPPYNLIQEIGDPIFIFILLLEEGCRQAVGSRQPKNIRAL
jgi:hypothetical protein